MDRVNIINSNKSYFSSKHKIDSVMLALLTNRLQIINLIIFSTERLQYPHMVWLIILGGVISQLYIYILSRWLSSSMGKKGVIGIFDLFGNVFTKIFLFVWLCFMLIKFIIASSYYVYLLHKYLMTQHPKPTLVLVLIISSVYLASKGFSNALKFSVIAFVFSVGILLLYILLMFNAFVSIQDIFPLFGNVFNSNFLNSMLLIWGFFSGPEYLILIGPYIRSDVNIHKSMFIGNLMTIIEYVAFFLGTFIFYGSDFLPYVQHSYINMINFLQFKSIQRLEMIILPVFMVNFTLSLAVILLSSFKAIVYITGSKKIPKETTLTFFMISSIFTFACIFFILKLFTTEIQALFWGNVLLYLSVFTYTSIPAIIFIAILAKSRRVK
ncbi:GerAB/ArcD/ProY family transporter [Clostridium cochlearium]|uniref:GerAB/ArcD/ProY family transporter n=1 Tax=Clostridium cochlearium TaxID=1494 RepID=UPI001459C82D|nr:GerAB/ArcD/ProY family transporter [Clostridium cochlearium]NME96530.1 GerAB/ArcD/ProY family transporter [Clostridium cochlearium]